MLVGAVAACGSSGSAPEVSGRPGSRLHQGAGEQRLPRHDRPQVRQRHDHLRAQARGHRGPHRPGRRPRARHRPGRHHRVDRRLQGRRRPLGPGQAGLRRRADRPEGHRHRAAGGEDRRSQARPDPRPVLGPDQGAVRHPVEVRAGRGAARGVQRLRHPLAAADRDDRQGPRQARGGHETRRGRGGEVRRGQDGQPGLR